jgi:hypothetical protein
MAIIWTIGNSFVSTGYLQASLRADLSYHIVHCIVDELLA